MISAKMLKLFFENLETIIMWNKFISVTYAHNSSRMNGITFLDRVVQRTSNKQICNQGEYHYYKQVIKGN
uniref:Uncharacterized protein n=1 Tax=Ascaris lumbricoides TaxID=6252 RepID=A0A0M3I4W8_ASCLU